MKNRSNVIRPLVLGVVIITLNVIFLKPSAAYFAAWVSGAAFLLLGISQLVSGKTKAPDNDVTPKE
jgi:predicted phage tail protein